MNVQHKDDGKKGIFYIELNGETIARMNYEWQNKTMVIDHTFVDDLFKGKGLGKLLVEQAVRLAERNNFKIRPECPFVKSLLQSGETYKNSIEKIE